MAEETSNGDESQSHPNENPQADLSPLKTGDEPTTVLTNGRGWDGKLRVPGRASLANPEALSDPEYSDEENVVQGEAISADEGDYYALFLKLPLPAQHSTRLPEPLDG